MSEDKNAVGRPSRYAEVLELSEKYLLGGWQEVGDVIPSVAGLACYAAVSRRLLYKYAEENEDFKRILEGILSMQENKLLNNGLNGTFNSTITKLVLGKHGYHDKVETESSADAIADALAKIMQGLPD